MITIPPRILDDIRARVRLSELIGQSVALKSMHRGEFSGLCPFHQEKTPSFTVSDPKGFYHCFGCGAHGDAIRFICEHDGLPFMEAVKQLAEQTGVTLPKPDKRQQEKERATASLFDVTTWATKWFQHQLTSTLHGREAASYLQQRGLSRETMGTFEIGFSPNQFDALYKESSPQRITKEQLQKVGLISQRTSSFATQNSSTTRQNENSNFYDRFRGRIMFPIHDSNGNVVGFGGRATEDNGPKYLNSPETEIFHKGSILYNEHRAKSHCYKEQQLILCEGYMDVIALWQAGIRTAMAPMGTAITPDQLQHLWRITPIPTLLLDGDRAGQAAMEKAALIALPLLRPGYSLRFAFLPEGKDPDDIIQSEGVAAINNIIKHTTSLPDFLLMRYREKHPGNQPDDRAGLQESLDMLAKKIGHPSLSQHYQSYFSEQTKKGFSSQDYSNRSKNASKKPRGRSSFSYFQEKEGLKALRVAPRPLDVQSIEGANLLLCAIIARSPSLLEDANIEDDFIRLQLDSKELDHLREQLLEGTNNDGYGPALPTQLQDILRTLPKLDTLEEAAPITPKNLWDYGMLHYHIAMLQRDYTRAYATLTEDSLLQAKELRVHIDQSQQKLRQMQLAFGESVW